MQGNVEKDVCEERKKWVNKRLDNHEERLDSLEKTYQSLERMNYQIEKIDENIHSINNKLETINSKPNKRYEAISMQIISFIIEAVLIIVAVKIGLK